MSRSFFEFFRCPSDAVRFDIKEGLSADMGYFQFGEGLTCYGTTVAVPLARHAAGSLGDALQAVCVKGDEIRLPFDPDQVVDCLRYERYTQARGEGASRLGAHAVIGDIYYLCRPLMPVAIRSILQRIYLRNQLKNPFPKWPVDRTVERLFEKLMELALKANGNVAIPFIWFWPDGAKAAFILTHDVETAAGVRFCSRLMDLDNEFGFRSAFQIVPEKRYEVTDSFLQEFRTRNFEVNVHDLNHDGNLFREVEEFRRRAERINQHLVRFGTRGFRSGALYRQLDWYKAFNISYDMSVPNVGHLEPQGGGCCTTMPYFVGNILEIPVTETQDYSLFHILNEYSIDLWKLQTETILQGNGLISLITHPDYLIGHKARSTYRQLLAYLAETCKAENVWATLPADIDRWWRMRHHMELVRVGDSWQIRGEGSERARIAYASLVEGRVQYNFESSAPEGDKSQVTTVENKLATPKFVLSEGNSFGGCGTPPSGAVIHPEEAAQSMAAHEQTQAENLPLTASQDESLLGGENVKIGMPLIEQQKVPSKAADLKAVARRSGESQRPLRVCMVAYSFYEADNRVMRYAETLAQEGHEVEVFALQQGDDPQEEVLGGVKVYRLQGRLINEKTKLTYVWRILLFLMRSLYQVSKHDFKCKYDLVHVHSVPDFLVFSALVPRLRGTPVILDIHDILPEFYMGKFGGGKDSLIFRLLRLTEWVCAKFASHVIIANHLWRERLLSRSVEPDKCTVVLNSPDRSIFHLSKEPPAKSDRFLLLYPGTLNWHQGLDIAIRAFSKISSEVPQAEFHIYGEGPSKQLLARLVNELGLQKRVFLHEPQKLREIARVIENADLGIVPKRTDGFGNEAFSTKIFEFMSMRVPVIVSDTRIDRYYFDDSLVRFFRGGDKDDLADCMLDLIQHPEKRRALVENATEFIAKNDWTAKKHEYLDMVDGLITKSRVQ